MIKPNNCCVFIGRLTKDPAIYRSEKICNAKYTLAIDSGYKNIGPSFADLVVFGEGNVSFAEKYLKKGMLIGVTCTMRQNRWTDKDGVKRVSTEYLVDAHTFLESKAVQAKHEEAHAQQAEEKKMDDYVNMIPDVGEEMPFA